MNGTTEKAPRKVGRALTRDDARTVVLKPRDRIDGIGSHPLPGDAFGLIFESWDN
jgi:hypothetical protein